MPLAAFPKCYLDDLIVYHTLTVEQWIDRAADQLDIDGLEFYWGFTPDRDPAALEALRRRVEARGLTIPMMCYSPDFTKPDAADRASEVDAARHAIAVTAGLGGSYCRVLSGQNRPEVARADGIRYAAECITELLPDAERHGVTLILENHYKDGYWELPEFAQKQDLFLELLAAIPASSHFGVNYDPSNAIIAGDDPIALLEAVKGRVVSMHASDRYFEGGSLADLQHQDLHPQRGYAPYVKHGVIGRGLNDYDRIFGILRDVGFHGWVSIEDGDDPAVGMDHLRESAQFLRTKMAEYGMVSGE
jgi:sugar phosphate isomerase/epimerase